MEEGRRLGKQGQVQCGLLKNSVGLSGGSQPGSPDEGYSRKSEWRWRFRSRHLWGMMSRACLTQGVWSGRTKGPGELLVRRGRKGERVCKSDGDRSHENMIHIPKSLHAPRKSLKVPGSQAKKNRDTRWGWWHCEVGENPVRGLMRRDIDLHYLWSDWRVNLWRRGSTGSVRPLDPRAWSLGLRS